MREVKNKTIFNALLYLLEATYTSRDDLHF